MYILVNVDDILITGNYPTLVAHVINSLADRFSLKNLGELNYFLGIEVKHVPNGILLSQSRYILEILSDLDMADCKGVTTPMCPSSPPKAGDGSPSADATLYRRTLVYAIPESEALESSRKGSSISQGIINIVSANLSSL
ncbi:hypothetical protein KY284_013035 [Solanum tuberosum]|nr:hypothetical protein KY284_013035 [Solanum tuberosum]